MTHSRLRLQGDLGNVICARTLYILFFCVPKEHPAMKITTIQEIMVLNYADVVLYDFSPPTNQTHSALEGSMVGTKAGKQRVACACTVLGRLRS